VSSITAEALEVFLVRGEVGHSGIHYSARILHEFKESLCRRGALLREHATQPFLDQLAERAPA
jgi:hypothetical protein